MVELPPPDWLTLPETERFLEDHGIELEAGRAAVVRAIKEGRISTQGRSARIHRNRFVLPLEDHVWDRATVNWGGSELTFQEPGAYWRSRVTDVQISRESLERWLGCTVGAVDVSGRPAPTQSTTLRSRRNISEADARREAQRYVERAMSNNSRGSIEFHVAEFQRAIEPRRIGRDRTRALLKELAPSNILTERGRPAKKSAKGKSARK